MFTHKFYGTILKEYVVKKISIVVGLGAEINKINK